MSDKPTAIMKEIHYCGSYNKDGRKSFFVTLFKVDTSPIGAFFILDRLAIEEDECAIVKSKTRTTTVYHDAKEAMINALNTWNEIIMTYQDEEPTAQEDEFPW